MITIQNVSRRPRKTGLHTYEICVTVEVESGKWVRRPIARFRHRREEGMPICLEKAAAAMRLVEAENMIALLGER